LSFGFIRTVAGKAAIGEYRANVPAEIHRRLGGGERNSCAEQQGIADVHKDKSI